MVLGEPASQPLFGEKIRSYYIYSFYEILQMDQRFKYKIEPLIYLEERKAKYFHTFGVEKDFLIMNMKSPNRKVISRTYL